MRALAYEGVTFSGWGLLSVHPPIYTFWTKSKVTGTDIKFLRNHNFSGLACQGCLWACLDKLTGHVNGAFGHALTSSLGMSMVSLGMS